MNKLEILSNISADKLNVESITDFFEIIKAVDVNNSVSVDEHVVKASDLRPDVVKSSTDEEKELIMKNFPERQGSYLIVPKVIQ